jgi:phosphoglycolate phosphatase
MKPAHDLLLFDLDGTLTDPIEGISRSMNVALAHFGYEPVDRSEIGAFIGPPLDHAFRSITGITDEGLLAEFVAKYRERYADVGYAENVVYAGVPEAVAQLAALGVPLAVCTSKRKDFAERILLRI